jgi:chromosome partitioning protein
VTTSGAKAAPRASPSTSAPNGDPKPPATRRKRAKKDPVPPETPGVARIIAIANQKGGVGKSTTAVSLGASLADLGYRVLVIDLDPQGNASTGMGIRHEARETTVYHVIVAESPIDDAIVQTPVERLQAVPSTIDLAGAEIELVSQFSRETRLKKALEPIREGRYDFVLLDCPPSLGLLTVNALTAAEELIVPIQCEYYALEGLGQLLRNVSLVQQNINPDLRLSGIVMTMFDPRTKLSSQVVEEVQRFFGELVYDVIIPRTVRLSEAPGFGQPITIYDPRSRGAQTYRQLAAEVASRPPPAEPMPIYDDLPTVVVAPLVDTVTPEPIADEDLDALPIPTVHEVVDDLQPEVEDQVATPQPKGEVAPPDPEPTRASAPEPESVPKPVPGPVPKPPSVAGSTGTPVAKNPVELPPPVDDEDVWEDADEPPPPSEPPPRAREPRASPEPTPPEHLPERRVVVIDEDAEPPASSRPSSRGAADDEPDSPTAVASIGATLEEEGPGKRRWRLFRKGGE